VIVSVDISSSSVPLGKVYRLSCMRPTIVIFKLVSKIAKATSSCLSVGTEQLGSHRTDFHEIWYLKIFRKPFQKIQVPLKSNKIKVYFTWRPLHIFIISRSILDLEWEMFQAKVVAKIKTHLLYPVTLFLKLCRLRDNVENYYWAGQATDDNMAHAHFILDT